MGKYVAKTEQEKMAQYVKEMTAKYWSRCVDDQEKVRTELKQAGGIVGTNKNIKQ